MKSEKERKMANQPAECLADQQEVKTVRMSRNYFCVDCKCSTRNPRLYLEHRRDFHKDQISIHGCDLCVYASKHSQKLTRHLRTVHRDVMQDAINPSVGNTFNQSFETISESLQSLQAGKNTRLSTCKLCGLYTASKTVLMEHVQAQHPEVRIYKCDQCEYSHYIRDRYNRHHRYHSMNHIRCKLCEFQTIYRWNLERHMRHHTDTVSFGFRCHKCNFTASTKQSITAHEIAHHNGLNVNNSLTETLQVSEMTNTLIKEELKSNDDKETDDESHFDANQFLEVIMDDNPALKVVETNGISQNFTPEIKIKEEPAPEFIEQQHPDQTKIFYCINCNFRYFLNSWTFLLLKIIRDNFCSSNEVDWKDSVTEELPTIYPGIKASEKQISHSSYRCGYCHQMSNWKHVIERHCRLVHNTPALIEKYSAEEQLYQCYTPIKRRLDTCAETIPTAKKMMHGDFKEEAVTHLEPPENALDLSMTRF